MSRLASNAFTVSGARVKPRAKPQIKAKTRQQRMDYILMLLILILLTIGLIMLFSASYIYAYYNDGGDSYAYIRRQVIFALPGVAVMLLVSRIDYHWYCNFLNKWAPIALMGGTWVLLVLALLGPEVKGTHRWIYITETASFQPSEIAKFAIVLLFAQIISNNHQEMSKTWKKGILPFALVLLPTAGLLILEPHISATILLLGMSVVMMWVGGTNAKWFIAIGTVAVVAIAAVIAFPDLLKMIAVYGGDRITYWLDPWADPRNKGYQTIQSMYTIASGGLMGVGLGKSKQKFLFLPEPQNDFIFAVVCEELGFVGAILIILLFILLVWRGFLVAMRAKDVFGTIMATGITAQVGLQALLNVMVVTNTIPNTGISLPFFSYGGTALLMLLGEMGILLNISRSSAIEKS